MADAKPFLKWAGGKTQLLNQFEKYFPKELKEGKIKYYYEPFVGSGAVFFDVISKYKIQKAFLYDSNPELINVYNVIRDYCQDLIKHLAEMQNTYLKKSESGRKEYFYKIREELNQYAGKTDRAEKRILIDKAARLLFLNKTCFNGLYRLNRKGEFNVPFGRYKNPKILNEDNLLKVSAVLQNVVTGVKDFSSALQNIKSPCFVYLDPPYMPISKTSSFTSYSKNDFTKEEQIRLAKFYVSLASKKNIWLMLSNSDPQNKDPKNTFFQNFYAARNKKIKIFKVPAKRMINSVADRRGAINELLIINYKV